VLELGSLGVPSSSSMGTLPGRARARRSSRTAPANSGAEMPPDSRPTPHSTPAAPEQPAPDPPGASPPKPSLGAAILLGLVAQALVILWIVASEVPAKVFISSWSFSMPGILVLSVLLLARRFAGRWRERWLSTRQVLLVYMMVAVSGVLAG